MMESGFHLFSSLFPHKCSQGGSDIIQVPTIIQAVHNTLQFTLNTTSVKGK